MFDNRVLLECSDHLILFAFFAPLGGSFLLVPFLVGGEF